MQHRRAEVATNIWKPRGEPSPHGDFWRASTETIRQGRADCRDGMGRLAHDTQGNCQSLPSILL